MTVQYYILLVMFQQISSLIYENICTSTVCLKLNLFPQVKTMWFELHVNIQDFKYPFPQVKVVKVLYNNNDVSTNNVTYQYNLQKVCKQTLYQIR